MKKSHVARYSVGIDEVGRGSLAGPVVVCAAIILKGVGFRVKGLGKPRDSKKLTAKQRDKWFDYLTNHPNIKFAIARVSSRVIDRINISRAANRAAERAVRRLIANRKSRIAQYEIYLDGGLYVGTHRMKSALIRVGNQRVSATTVIRGDEKIPAISMASIIAKVTRDRLMVRLAKKYPRYGFEAHKGYGTRRHYKAIRKRGASAIHRLTFLGRI